MRSEVEVVLCNCESGEYVRAPYNTTGGRDSVKTPRLCLHGTCPQGNPLEGLEKVTVRACGRSLGFTTSGLRYFWIQGKRLGSRVQGSE